MLPNDGIKVRITALFKKKKLSPHEFEEISSFYKNIYQKNLIKAHSDTSKKYNEFVNETKIGIIYDMIEAGGSDSRISMICKQLPDFDNDFLKNTLSNPHTKLFRNKILTKIDDTQLSRA